MTEQDTAPLATGAEDIMALCDYAERAAEEIETERDWAGSPLERLDEEGKLLDRRLLARVRLAVATGPAPPAPEPVCANQDCGHKQDEHYSGECWGSPRCYCSAFVSAPPAPEPDPVLLAISEVYRCLVDQEYPENDTLLRLRNAWRCCHGISLMRSVDVEPEIMAYGVKS